MKKLFALFALCISLAAGLAHAASDRLVALDRAPVTTNKLDSLQRGAKLFVNYCMGCHSAAYVRYNRLRDIGLTEEQIKSNLLFTGDKVGDVMKSSMDPASAKAWFGGLPPDLSLVARSRSSGDGSGADYLYTLLRTYYRDPSKPTGWNNAAYPNIGMPHPLWELQGERAPVMAKVKDHGKDVEKLTGWTQATPGKLSQLEYDQAIGDLVGFLSWAAEPYAAERKRIGVWVLLFLGLFIFVAWRLNAAYWKDVH
jgi:ubiquinol-cytochrome c reductase cytochrome c1 subunit